MAESDSVELQEITERASVSVSTRSVSVSTQTDDCQQEVRAPTKLYRDTGSMTDDIQFKHDFTHDHCYCRPVEEYKSPLPSPSHNAACSDVEEWEGSDGGSSMEEGSIADECDDEFEMDDYDCSEDESESEVADEEVNLSQDRKSIVSTQELLKLFRVCHWEGCGKCLNHPPTVRKSGFGLQIKTECIHFPIY